MIVITRRHGEGIVIGDDIVVTIVGIHRDAVRLVVQCPNEVSLRREKLIDSVHGTTEAQRGYEETGSGSEYI